MALGAAGEPGVPALLRLVQDPNEDLREAASQSLERISSSLAGSVAAAALEHPR